MGKHDTPTPAVFSNPLAGLGSASTHPNPRQDGREQPQRNDGVDVSIDVNGFTRDGDATELTEDDLKQFRKERIEYLGWKFGRLPIFLDLITGDVYTRAYTVLSFAILSVSILFLIVLGLSDGKQDSRVTVVTLFGIQVVLFNGAGVHQWKTFRVVCMIAASAFTLYNGWDGVSYILDSSAPVGLFGAYVIAAPGLAILFALAAMYVLLCDVPRKWLPKWLHTEPFFYHRLRIYKAYVRNKLLTPPKKQVFVWLARLNGENKLPPDVDVDAIVKYVGKTDPVQQRKRSATATVKPDDLQLSGCRRAMQRCWRWFWRPIARKARAQKRRLSHLFDKESAFFYSQRLLIALWSSVSNVSIIFWLATIVFPGPFDSFRRGVDDLIKDVCKDDSDPALENRCITRNQRENDDIFEALKIIYLPAIMFAYFTVLYLLWKTALTYRTRMLNIRRGHPFWSKAVSVSLFPTVTLIGLQNIMAILSFLLVGLSFFLAFSGVALFIAWKVFRDWVISKVGSFLVSIAGILLLSKLVLSNVVKKYLLGVQGTQIRHRRWYMLFDLIFVFSSMIMGLLTALKKVVKQTFWVFLYMVRVDTNVFQISIDGGYAAYCSCVYMDHVHTNPILYALCHSLYADIKERRQQRWAGYQQSPSRTSLLHAQHLAVDGTPRTPKAAYGDTHEQRHLRARIRARFWLYYVMSVNPQLVQYRKHRIAERIDNLCSSYLRRSVDLRRVSEEAIRAVNLPPGSLSMEFLTALETDAVRLQQEQDGTVRRSYIESVLRALSESMKNPSLSSGKATSLTPAASFPLASATVATSTQSLHRSTTPASVEPVAVDANVMKRYAGGSSWEAENRHLVRYFIERRIAEALTRPEAPKLSFKVRKTVPILAHHSYRGTILGYVEDLLHQKALSVPAVEAHVAQFWVRKAMDQCSGVSNSGGVSTASPLNSFGQ